MQKIVRQFSMIVLLMSTWAGIQPAAAQYTSNYQTNIISGVTSYWPGDYVVGSNTFANALLIRNGGVLTNADGYVGYLPASNTNFVMVAGAGSVWSNANLYFGYSGGGNTLVISNAGSVADSQGTYVAYNATSSSNRVLVAGTNSAWNCANSLELGYAGFGNSLVISNGGQVTDAGAYVGESATSSGNTALITGAGSVWSNTGFCMVGRAGSNNKITINKGGRLVSNFATLGDQGAATNNSVVVSDSGSLWDDSAEASVITFGAYGSGNSLVVTNGGQGFGYYAYFGRFGSGNNSALVTGPGSSFSVNCYIYVGDQGHDNTFTVANGAAVSDKFCYISYSAGSSNNAVLITGANSSWQNSYSVFVGYDGVGGSLTISNGASMSYINTVWTMNHSSILGYDSTSKDNRALVTGGGSVWDCSGDMYVGVDGHANSLVISNGGRVISGYGILGLDPGSDSNSVMVAGAGSVWTNYSNVYVGNFGVGNGLVISNGGQVNGFEGLLGYDASSSNNGALVTGAGSVWSNATTMKVGYFGPGNSLVISNGARVISSYGFLGTYPGSDNNSALVTGASSLWTNSANVFVGDSGSSNRLVISNGGRVSDDMGVIGYDTNSFNNQALVTGAGSVWSNATAMFVGYLGSSNRLVIGDGGLVTGYWGLIGEADFSSSNNTALVETGGVWRSHELVVGDAGPHNTLLVEGGSVFATNMIVGNVPPSSNNLVQLDSGQIIVTNQTHSAVLEVYGGSFVLNGGTLRVDTLIVTNVGAQFMHIGGTLIYRTLQLNPNQSAVGDGIPNWWKQQYGFDPFDPTVAGADPDHDGVNNLQEYLAGTNPTNAASVFHIISAAKTNKDVRVTWSTVGGHNYVLQTNGDPGAGKFADFGPVISVGGMNAGTTNCLDSGAATNHSSRFYRVRLGP
jgi:T5SS/PEP-CTERM-associated repeat protein